MAEPEFAWFWCDGPRPIHPQGRFPDGNAALAAARRARPFGDISVVEGCRRPIECGIFDADAILAQLVARNPQCWGDAGLPSLNEFEKQDLAAKLMDCLDRWVRKTGLDDTTSLAAVRSHDYFQPSDGSRDHG